MRILALLALGLSPCAHGATLEIVNHTGADARLAELFNVCTQYVVPADKPVALKDGESARFEVPLVMQHYKICGSGFCSSAPINLRDGQDFQLEMTLTPGGIIDGVAHPDQWDGKPSNECPAP